MNIAIIPIVVAIIGLLMYLLVPNAKAQEIGRIMFWTGLLATLLSNGAHTISIR